jgi:X-Pro dipeptidyl-peptidase (S15 family)
VAGDRPAARPRRIEGRHGAVRADPRRPRIRGVAYSARGEGTSTGNLELSGPKEISDERALESFFARLPNVSNTKIGGWGVSYGGDELWDGLAAGIPYKAAAVVATWTDLYSALWPQDVAKSGIVAGFAGAVDARSPLVTGIANDAVRSTNLPALRSLAAERSSLRGLPSVRTPVYIFQGRVDYAFDVTQAEDGFLRVRGPKHLYIGQFGHPPSTFATADLPYVQSQTLAWFDHYLKGAPNGVDRSKPVTIAAARGTNHASYAGIPRTKVVTVGFRGATLGPRTGPRFRRALETFGVSVLRLQVRKVSRFPRLVATVRAGSRVITHGAIVPKVGLHTMRLANYVQYLPRGTRLSVTFGDSSGADLTYLGFGDPGRISLGPAELELQVLPRPVSR